jgi:signal transduction histidine kinase
MTEETEELLQRTIRSYSLDLSDQDDAFDRVTGLAIDLFDVPIALVTVLGSERQFFRGSCGVDVDGTPREAAFCNFTVGQDEVFVIEDARADPRFCANPLVTGPPFIRFYAGAPITLKNGVAIGSLCLIDREPRAIDEADKRRLQRLARSVADLMELRVGSLLATQREEALRRQGELLRTLVETVDLGVALFDEDLRLVLSNDKFFAYHGLDRGLGKVGTPAEDLLRQSIRNGIFGADATVAMLPDMIAAIKSEPSHRLLLKTVDGRFLESVLLRIEHQGGWVIMGRDCTAERVAIRAKDEFVATVSHELRTPLTAIRGALALLGRSLATPLEERGEQMLGMASKNAERLSLLIDDILDFERFDNGTVEFVMLPIDLREIVRDGLEQNQPLAAASGVGLRYQPSPAPLLVRGDPGRLLQVLTNFLSNAIKFSPDGGTVEIRTEQQSNKVSLSVLDQGPGVPPEFLNRLFTRFAQSGMQSRRGHGGTGLGLAISRAIIERHGGTIDYQPNADGGSCFAFTLPDERLQ